MCHVRGYALNTQTGATGPSSTASRTCLKTPQAASFGRRPPPYTASRPGFGALCMPGTRFGGQVSTSLGVGSYLHPFSTGQCASLCAQQEASCGAFRLGTDGTCELYRPYTPFSLPMLFPHGPDSSTAVSCLMSEATYYCLPQVGARAEPCRNLHMHMTLARNVVAQSMQVMQA